MNGNNIVLITKRGIIKKTSLEAYSHPRTAGVNAVNLREGDELVDVLLVNDASHFLVVTRNGMAIRFDGSEVRVMGLVAAGVNAIKLAGKDLVAGIVELAGKGDLVLVASNGLGWRIEPDGFPVQGRYGQGVIGCRLEPGVELIGVVYGKKNYQFTLHFKKAAARTCRVDDINQGRRAGKGEQLVQLTAGDDVRRIVTTSDAGE